MRAHAVRGGRGATTATVPAGGLLLEEVQESRKRRRRRDGTSLFPPSRACERPECSLQPPKISRRNGGHQPSAVLADAEPRAIAVEPVRVNLQYDELASAMRAHGTRWATSADGCRIRSMPQHSRDCFARGDLVLFVHPAELYRHSVWRRNGPQKKLALQRCWTLQGAGAQAGSGAEIAFFTALRFFSTTC